MKRLVQWETATVCKRSAVSPALLLVLVSALAGCNHGVGVGGQPAKPRAGGAAPETISVGEASLTLGFASTMLRDQTTVPAFRITKHPITVGDYRACVSAGACTEPRGKCDTNGALLDRPTYSGAPADVPLTCATPAQAEAYCAWINGRLPTASEWLLAARGTAVHRYPWGDDPSTCTRHPLAEGIFAEKRACCAGADNCTIEDLARVGTHPAGASAAGLEDVLFAGGELTVSDAHAALASCGGRVCMLSGRGPAIEGLVPASAEGNAATTFRCAIAEGGQ
jgi:formylglycine-generating enzyme required for sulfatase activity